MTGDGGAAESKTPSNEPPSSRANSHSRQNISFFSTDRGATGYSQLGDNVSNPYASLLAPTHFTATSPFPAIGTPGPNGIQTPMSSRQSARIHPYRRYISYEILPYVPDPGPSSDS